MTAPRTQIRAAVVTRLAQNLAVPPAAPSYRTAAGPRVYSGRLMPIEEPDLPAIVVHTRDPEAIVERSASGWGGYEKRRCIVSILCIMQSYEDIDEELDAMADQVEAAIQAWTIPGRESAELNLIDTGSGDPDFEGDLTTNVTTLRYECVYMTPYRDCSNPYVQAGDEPIERSGAYPGGRVTAGCPVGGTGEACPIDDADLFSQGEPIN